MKTILPALLLIAASVAQAQPDTITIPHDLHFEMEMACADCHLGIAGSTSHDDLARPEMDTCADCHDIDDDDNCAMCHTNVDEAGMYEERPPHIGIFSHAVHVGGGLDCAACHGDPALPARPLPAMTDCRVCHETADDGGDCALCHLDSEDLRPADHGAGWIHLHAIDGGIDQTGCATCHAESECLACHAGDNLRPRSHGLDFAFTHSLAARGNEFDCRACHVDNAFCVSCHVAEMVVPRSHARGGWVGGGDGGRHAIDGLFEMESCIACHDAGEQSPTCAECHEGDSR